MQANNQPISSVRSARSKARERPWSYAIVEPNSIAVPFWTVFLRPIAVPRRFAYTHRCADPRLNVFRRSIAFHRWPLLHLRVLFSYTWDCDGHRVTSFRSEVL